MVRSAFLIFFVTILVGCATGHVVKLPHISADESSSQLVLIRSINLVGAAQNNYIALDGGVILSIGPGEYANVQIPSGEHVVSVFCYGGWALTWIEDAKQFYAQPRQTHYFLVSPSLRCAKITPIPQEKAKSIISKSTLIGPREEYSAVEQADSDVRDVVMPEVSGRLPPGKNWAEIPGFDQSMHVYGSKGTHEDETYAVVVREIPLTPSESIHEFAENVRKIHKGSRGSQDLVVSDELRLIPDSEKWCMEYESVSICEDAKRYSHRTDHMMLHEIGRYCRHPEDHNILLQIYYSRRFYSGDEAPGFMGDAKIFLEGISF